MVTSRLGMDQPPVSLSDTDGRAWLESSIWLEDVEGMAVLRSAIDLAASATGPTVVTGEAITDPVRLLAKLQGREPIAVFTASLLSYLTTEGTNRVRPPSRTGRGGIHLRQSRHHQWPAVIGRRGEERLRLTEHQRLVFCLVTDE
jgi:hypothetical protein